MPFTVITLRNVPPSLRGDLTKWMQEIATGVYVGNFNSRLREYLWKRVCDSVGSGEATLSYSLNNEIGYDFETLNTQREPINFEGIPLILIPCLDKVKSEQLSFGFSNAAKVRKANQFSKIRKGSQTLPFVVMDIETDGLDEKINNIIEVAALKVNGSTVEEFHSLIKCEKAMPKDIVQITGITDDVLSEKGNERTKVMQDFISFIGDHILVGFAVDFDIRFLNQYCKSMDLPLLKNRRVDLLRLVKKEKIALQNYKLETVLSSYEINKKVPHRALADTQLILELSSKVNKFQESLRKEWDKH